MIRKLLVSLATALLAMSAQADIVDIDNAELARLAISGVPVIDIRTEGEWKESGIVPGSRLITLFDEKGRPDPAWLEKVKGVAKPDQPVIIICRSGNRTKAVSQFLSQQAGYATVYNVKQGIKGWIAAGGPVVPATQSIASCKIAKTC